MYVTVKTSRTYSGISVNHNQKLMPVFSWSSFAYKDNVVQVINTRELDIKTSFCLFWHAKPQTAWTS